jgi:hypothetical protein
VIRGTMNVAKQLIAAISLCSAAFSVLSGCAPDSTALFVASHAHQIRERQDDAAYQGDAMAQAYDCLGLLESAKIPGRSADAPLAQVIGKRLLRISDLGHESWAGWGLPAGRILPPCLQPGSWDAFQDGTCNAPGAKYGFQGYLAGSCLLGLYERTQDATYLDPVRSFVDGYWTFGAEARADEETSFTFSYSADPNDRGRFTRGVNAMLGALVARLYADTGERRYFSRALAVGEAERAENRRGNFGYLSSLDPAWRASPSVEAGRIENHLPFTAVALEDLSLSLGGDRFHEDAVAIFSVWADCKNAVCLKSQCGSWSGDPARCVDSYTFAFCLMPVRAAFAAYCQQAVSA